MGNGNGYDPNSDGLPGFELGDDIQGALDELKKEQEKAARGGYSKELVAKIITDPDMRDGLDGPSEPGGNPGGNDGNLSIPELKAQPSGIGNFDPGNLDSVNPGGYINDEFDFDEGITTSDLSDTDDNIDISPIQDQLHPLVDIGINPSAPIIISTHDFNPSKVYNAIDAEIPENTYDITSEAIATYRKYNEIYQKAAGSFIDRVEKFIGDFSHIMCTYSRTVGYPISGGGTSFMSMNTEAEMSYSVDAVLSVKSTSLAAEIEAQTILGGSWEQMHNAGFSRYVDVMYAGNFQMIRQTEVPEYSIIEKEKSVSLRVDQTNMVQPFIARAMWCHLDSWVATKELISNMGNVKTGVKYFTARDLGLSDRYLQRSVTEDYGHPELAKPEYTRAAAYNLVEGHGFRHESDMGPQSHASLRRIAAIFSSETGDPLKEIFTEYLGYTGDSSGRWGTRYHEATRTKLFSQLVYDLYEHVRYGGLALSNFNEKYYRNRSVYGSPATNGDRINFLRTTRDNNDMRRVIDSLKSITPTDSGASFPSDEDLESLISNLPSTNTSKITVLCAALAKDYFQSVGISHKNHMSDFNSAYEKLTGESPGFGGDTSLDSYYEAVFGANSIRLTNDDFPGRGTLMSTAKVDIEGSSFQWESLLPIESFTSIDMNTGGHTSGYEYFVEEAIAAVATREYGGGAATPYGDGDYSNVDFGPGPGHRPRLAYSNVESGPSKGYLTSLTYTAPNDFFGADNRASDDRPLSGEIMGTRHTWILKNIVLNSTLKYMTGNTIFELSGRSFGTVGSDETIGTKNLHSRDYSRYAPLTQTFLSGMYHQANYQIENLIKRFTNIGEFDERFNPSPDDADLAIQLGILSAIARSDDNSLKLKYIKYCDELFKLYESSETISSVSITRGPGYSAGDGTLVVQNTYTDSYLSALNDLDSASSGFVEASTDLALAVIDEVGSGYSGFTPFILTEFGGEFGGGGGDGMLPADGVDYLEGFSSKEEGSFSSDGMATTFSSVLLTPIGRTLVQAASSEFMSKSIIATPVISLRSTASNLPDYYEDSSGLDLGFSGMLLNNQQNLLRPGDSGSFITSRAFEFNALTYVRSLSLAWLFVIDDTLGQDSTIFSFSMNYNSSDFTGDAGAERTKQQTVEDGIFQIDVKTPQFRAFGLAIHQASGNCTTPVNDVDYNGFYRYGMSNTGLAILDSDERGDSHFYGDDEDYFISYHNRLCWPMNRCTMSDEATVLIYQALENIGSWWTTCAAQIIRPNGNYDNAQWKKWLQYGALMGATRQFGHMSSRETVACMQHYIREYLTYDSLPIEQNSSGDTYSKTRLYALFPTSTGQNDDIHDHYPFNYPLGEKITPRTRKLVNWSLDGGWPSGNFSLGGGTVSLGRSLKRESLSDVGKIVTVGIPTGMLDGLRRKVHHNLILMDHREGSATQGLTRLDDPLVKISIYKYDLENDDIFYPDPVVFTVCSSMFYPQAFPEMAGTSYSRSQDTVTTYKHAYNEFKGYAHRVGSTDASQHHHLFSIQRLIPNPHAMWRFLDNSQTDSVSAYLAAPMCFGSARFETRIGSPTAQFNMRGGCAFLTGDQIPKKSVLYHIKNKANSEDVATLNQYTYYGGEVSGGNGQGSHFIGIKSAAFRNITYDSELYYNTAGLLGWWNTDEMPEQADFQAIEGYTENINSFKADPLEYLSRHPIHIYAKNWLYINSVESNQLVNDASIHNLFGTTKDYPGYNPSGSTATSYAYVKNGSQALGSGGIITIDPDNGYCHFLNYSSYDVITGYSHADVAEAYINCFKDAILKTIVKLDTGVDLREVGFPVFPQDTSYTATNSGTSDASLRSWSGRDSEPAKIISNSGHNGYTYPAGLQINPQMLVSLYDIEEQPDVAGYVTTEHAKLLGGVWGCTEGFDRSTSTLDFPTTFTANINPHPTELRDDGGHEAAEWQTGYDYFSYLQNRNKLYLATKEFATSEGYVDGKFDQEAFLKSYRLGAPVSRAKATLPNKFERTFSFLVDPNKDFTAFRNRYDVIRDSDGVYISGYASDDDAVYDGWTVGDISYREELPDHVSNMYGFYATVELVERNNDSR